MRVLLSGFSAVDLVCLSAEFSHLVCVCFNQCRSPTYGWWYSETTTTDWPLSGYGYDPHWKTSQCQGSLQFWYVGKVLLTSPIPS